MELDYMSKYNLKIILELGTCYCQYPIRNKYSSAYFNMNQIIIVKNIVHLVGCLFFTYFFWIKNIASNISFREPISITNLMKKLNPISGKAVFYNLEQV